MTTRNGMEDQLTLDVGMHSALDACGYPVFREIVDRGEIIGTERCNKAKIG